MVMFYIVLIYTMTFTGVTWLYHVTSEGLGEHTTVYCDVKWCALCIVIYESNI